MLLTKILAELFKRLSHHHPVGRKKNHFARIGSLIDVCAGDVILRLIRAQRLVILQVTNESAFATAKYKLEGKRTQPELVTSNSRLETNEVATSATKTEKVTRCSSIFQVSFRSDRGQVAAFSFRSPSFPQYRKRLEIRNSGFQIHEIQPRPQKCVSVPTTCVEACFE